MIPDQSYSFDPNAFNSVMLNAVQLLPLNTRYVTQLIAAVCSFYVKQMTWKGRAFKNTFWEFRTSILPLFVLKLSSIQSAQLLKAVQCLLFSHGPDRSIFVQKFLWTLFSHMSAIDDYVSGTAWSIFRQWVLTDYAPEECIFAVQGLKGAFLTLAQSALDNAASSEELILLRDGFTGDPNIRKPLRSRGSGFFVKMKHIRVPGYRIMEELNMLMKENS
jgi:hypothetical protein